MAAGGSGIDNLSGGARVSAANVRDDDLFGFSGQIDARTTSAMSPGQLYCGAPRRWIPLPAGAS